MRHIYIYTEIFVFSHCANSSIRVVVLVVFLINFHTWGMNSVSYSRIAPQPGLLYSRTSQAYAVFLAYYLTSNAFPGSSAISLAFVGGLSISIGMSSCRRPYSISSLNFPLPQPSSSHR